MRGFNWLHTTQTKCFKNVLDPQIFHTKNITHQTKPREMFEARLVKWNEACSAAVAGHSGTASLIYFDSLAIREKTSKDPVDSVDPVTGGGSASGDVGQPDAYAAGSDSGLGVGS
jgi:hypothetical protein